jgi:putative cell wall-binding protein
VALTLALTFLSAASASAITRSTILWRAQDWVDRKIPYSQSKYVDGYRTDCSGMVSMAWRLDHSYWTGTLASVCATLTKSQLRPGDMMLLPRTHALIFGGWTDASKTQYIAYEESSSHHGAVSRVTPYPYWGTSGLQYRPYRLRGIEETPDYATRLDQIAGVTRYSTALRASQIAFTDDSRPDVVLATGSDWPDALGASALAGAVGGPLLLTPGTSLPPMVARELARLGTRRVWVAGGTASVSGSVLEAVRRAVPGVTVDVRRVGGSTRYATAAAVAATARAEAQRRSVGTTGTAMVVTGRDFPDALAGAPLAAREVWPVLLTERDRLPTSTSDALDSLGVTQVLVLGGPTSVSAAVVTALSKGGRVRVIRIQGRDRFETAVKVAQWAVSEQGCTWGDVGLASGETFADALAGGVAQGRAGSVMLLTAPGRLPRTVSSALTASAPALGRPRLYGGESSLGRAVRDTVYDLLAPPVP